MPKRKSKNTSKIKDSVKYRGFKKWKNQHKLLFILLILGLIWFGFWVKKQVDIYNERKDFQTAEKVVSGLVEEIQQELGSTDVEEYRQCSYGTVKFEKKNLGCTIGYNFGYIVTGYVEVEQYAEAVDRILSTSEGSRIVYSEKNDFRDKDYSSTSALTLRSSKRTIDINNSEEIRCTLSHLYSVNKKDTEKRYDISFVCRSPDGTLTNYYPITD